MRKCEGKQSLQVAPGGFLIFVRLDAWLDRWGLEEQGGDVMINLRRAIRELMRRAWLDSKPSAKCFDHDETRMDLLLQFRERRASAEDIKDVRSHLLECPRCRYVYTIVLKTEA